MEVLVQTVKPKPKVWRGTNRTIWGRHRIIAMILATWGADSAESATKSWKNWGKMMVNDG
jgi:hypothetical protein